MRTVLFELCAESLEAAEAANFGGADRIELCSELSIGGVTPSLELLCATIKAISIPVHVLIRPRGGDFAYSADEFGQMRRQIEQAKQAGASGVVTGVLLPNRCVDVARSRELAELARPLAVTFHRAFDRAPNLSDALEAVIEIGADCLLTSGGKPDVLTGADSIARLVQQGGSRLQIIAGGGLRMDSLVEILRRTGVSCLHGSLLRRNETPGGNRAVLEADVREAVRLLRRECGDPAPATQSVR
jgi:copper homeostasis protein